MVILDGIPGDGENHGAVHGRNGAFIAVLRGLLPVDRDAVGSGRDYVAEERRAFDLFPLGRHTLDLPKALLEPPEEPRGGKLVESGLGALEEQLGQAVDSERTPRRDHELLFLVGTLDRDDLPGIAVDQGVDAQIPVGVVELKEDHGIGKTALLLVFPGHDGHGGGREQQDGGRRPEAERRTCVFLHLLYPYSLFVVSIRPTVAHRRGSCLARAPFGVAMPRRSFAVLGDRPWLGVDRHRSERAKAVEGKRLVAVA